MTPHTLDRQDVYSRRVLGRLLLAGAVVPAALTRALAPAGSVRIGVHAASFERLARTPGEDAIDTLIHAITACGVRECELYAPLLEPSFGSASHHHRTMAAMSPQMMRRELRKWRVHTPLWYFDAIGRRFSKAGIAITAYSYNPDTTFSAEEIDRGFTVARALGAEIVSASVTRSMANRMAPFANRHGMTVALSVGAGDLTRPEDVANTLKLSPHFRLALDLGPAAADGHDVVHFIREHHDRLATLRLIDCGERLGWGHGDAPIAEALEMVKREGWAMRAYVECTGEASGASIAEVRRCVDLVKQALG
jgi:sugar phosphate isomerase/epimerase